MEMQHEAQCFSVHSDPGARVWLVGGCLHGLATWTWDMIHFQCFAALLAFVFLRPLETFTVLEFLLGATPEVGILCRHFVFPDHL